MKKVLSFILVISLLTGCATFKKVFCNIDFDTTISTLSTEIHYVESIYWHYVNLLKNDPSDDKIKNIIITMDIFLAISKPLLKGLQYGVCYDTNQINFCLELINTIKKNTKE